MTFVDDIKTLFYLTLAPRRGATHAERVENFYRGQANHYDDFRNRLLKGRKELLQTIPWTKIKTWADFGAGTGANVEFVDEERAKLEKIYLIDLSPSLLEIAKKRVEARNWWNVDTVLSDVCAFKPKKKVDLVTFSYSLTMIPNWRDAVDHAYEILRPSGTLAIVDFHVSKDHDWLTQKFWPSWFAFDGVHLNPNHLPYLQSKFETQSLESFRARVPYFPVGTVPYYHFVGKKPRVYGRTLKVQK